MRRWILAFLLFSTRPALALALDDDTPEEGKAKGSSESTALGGDAHGPGETKESGGSGGSGTGRGEEKGTIGVGIVVGEPFGICGRLYLKDDQAIQAAVGAGFIGGGIQVHADYAFHPYILQTRESFVLATYVGPGVRVAQHSDGRDNSYIALGVRAVGGLLFDFKNPLDAFFEVAGVFEYEFADGKGLGAALNAGAGVRYYF
jgi:hypothetical protein